MFQRDSGEFSTIAVLLSNPHLGDYLPLAN
jgi:hypothetical protein